MASSPLKLGNRELTITASSGVGVIAAEDRVLDDLLRRADRVPLCGQGRRA